MVSDRKMSLILAAAVVSTALSGSLGTAMAQARAPASFDPRSLNAGTLEVPLNKSKVVSADRAIAKALVGNEEIADILPLTDKAIYVLGKKMGTTSLTLYDAGGRVLSVMDIAVGPDVETLGTQLRELVPDETIEARISNDSIVLTGMVNNPGAVDRAVQLAKTYAGEKVVNLISVGSSQQVMLEVRFAEVSRKAGTDIGMNFSGGNRSGSFSGVSGAGSGFVPAAPDGSLPSYLSSVGVTGAFGVFRQRFSIGALSLNGMLNALETKGLSKTLAQPTLTSLSGEKASFLAGGEFPIPVAQSNASGGAGSVSAITVEFKSFGVSLGFTPTVLGDKTINLVVEPEVSEIDPTASIVLNGISIPGLRTRRASTTLELRDGESFAIAGLLQSDIKTTAQQLPLLGSIPILGALFRSTQFQKGQTELLIVVTPRLVAPIRPDQVRLPTDSIADPTALGTTLLGDPTEPRPLAPAAPAAPAASPAPKKDDGYAL